MKQKCQRCNGRGHQGKYICMNCFGHGKVLWTHNLIKPKIKNHELNQFVFFDELQRFMKHLKEKYRGRRDDCLMDEFDECDRYFLEIQNKYKLWRCSRHCDYRENGKLNVVSIYVQCTPSDHIYQFYHDFFWGDI